MARQKVLIVGAGPIGLFLAVDLARYGIAVRIIDKLTSATTLTKALTINSSSLKAFQGLGIDQDFLANGKILQVGEAYFNGHLTARLNKKYLDSQHNYFLSIPQTVTEKLFQKKLNSYGIGVEYQKELLELNQDEAKVKIKIKNHKTNVIEEEQFDFVIGCDGAHSIVRNLIGLSFTGHTYDMYFVVADVYFEDNCVVEKSTYFIDETGGFIGTFLMSTGCTRLVIKKDGSLPRNKPAVKKEEMQSYLDEHKTNKPLKIKELVWSTAAQIITRTTECGQVNRVFIAGDAYHLFSPVGGHNMNSGFQDAINLGWKLSYYIKGWAKKTLIDTYSNERDIAIQKLLETTNLNTQIVMRKNKNHEKIEYYKPKLSNRTFYRTQFPYEFAGYFADHSTNEKSLIGKHVPYIKFSKSYLGLKSTYDIPCLKKFILFHFDDLQQPATISELADYKQIIEIIKVSADDKKNFINQLQLNNQKVCAIRPDGFVGFHGNLSEFSLYFKQYHHTA